MPTAPIANEINSTSYVLTVVLYLVSLTLAPQEWIGPFIGLPTDYICFVIMFVALVGNGRIVNCFKLSPLDMLLVMFATLVTVSAIKAGWTAVGQDRVIFYWKMVLLVKLVEGLIDNIGHLRAVTVCVVALGVLLAIQAIHQKLSVDGMGWANQGRGWIDPIAAAAGEKGRSRWIGNFGGQGTSAVLLTTAYPFTLAFLIRQHGIFKKLVAAIAASLLLWGIYCTGSRGGLLAILSVTSLYIMIRAKISAASILKVSTLVLVVYALAPSHLTTVVDSSNSTQYRVEMWAAGLDMLKGNPVLGVGPGHFKVWSGKLIGHNSAVELQGELGIFGLLIWLSMIFLSLKGVLAYRAHTTDEREKWFATGLALSLTGYVVSAMFVTLEYETFYLLLAFCAVLNRCLPNPVSLTRKDMWTIVTIAGAWLLVLQFFVIVYIG